VKLTFARRTNAIRFLLPVVGLLVFGILYSTVFLELPSRWWFEDDPALFSYTAKIGNPVVIFDDPGVLRNFTGGSALVPMQLLSYWIDLKIAGISPRFAYAHQMGSFLLALLFLYLLLSRWLPGRRAAPAIVVAAWAILPSTAVVLQFLATRHYLEGLLFSCVALFLCERLKGSREQGAGSREQGAGSREQGAGSIFPGGGRPPYSRRQPSPFFARKFTRLFCTPSCWQQLGGAETVGSAWQRLARPAHIFGIGPGSWD
jgi:hypothetical protein